MQRYFVPNEQFQANTVTITGDDARHIVRVMRMRPGDEIILCNHSGQAYAARITSIHETGSVSADIVSPLDQRPELPVHVTVAQGLPKGDKLDLIVQKGTELGAREFWLFPSERSVVKWEGAAKVERKLGRLHKIAKEAAEQSHRNFIPAIRKHEGLEDLINESRRYEHKLVAYEEDAKTGRTKGLPELFRRIRPGESLIAVIGPEGGFTAREVSALERAGFHRCSFGRRILRTETAPLYLLSSVSYYFELENGVN